MRLPDEFIEKMKSILGNEWQELLEAWEEPPHQGLRVNTLKISPGEFRQRWPSSLEPIPWTRDGFYYQGEDRPAKHPYHQAGLYYLQEPSAMAPAASLGVEPGDRVLDLCAAPGGKSTQIAAFLQGQGLLVSNDNSEERVKTLAWNLERWGAANCVVTREEPAHLARFFPGFFDKILIDAPCSGEGMFRKDPKAVRSWTGFNSAKCSLIQKDILKWGAVMLKPGGRMVYSTCTFSPEENEEVINSFLREFPEFSLIELPLNHGWEEGGVPGFLWKADAAGELRKTRRLMPHRVRGEGHFLALVEKRAALKHENKAMVSNMANSGIPAPLEAFAAEYLTRTLPGPFLEKGPYIYQVPPGLPNLEGLKLVRHGWFLGTIKNKRFEPSQHLALGLTGDDVRLKIRLTPQDPLTERYLKGETLLIEGPRGWTLVCLEEFPLGWGKQTGDYLKNNYPIGWRLG